MIDWDRLVVFEDGEEAYLHATLSKTGKCKFAKTGESIYSDSYATWWEQGVRWLVHSSPNGGQSIPYGENGYPVSIYDTDVNMPIHFSAQGRRIVQKDTLIQATEGWRQEQAAMASSDLWGMF